MECPVRYCDYSDHNDLSLLSLLLQRDRVCGGQRHLPEGSAGCGRIPVRAVDRRRDRQERSGSHCGVQQTR